MLCVLPPSAPSYCTWSSSCGSGADAGAVWGEGAVVEGVVDVVGGEGLVEVEGARGV